MRQYKVEYLVSTYFSQYICSGNYVQKSMFTTDPVIILYITKVKAELPTEHLNWCPFTILTPPFSSFRETYSRIKGSKSCKWLTFNHKNLYIFLSSTTVCVVWKITTIIITHPLQSTNCVVKPWWIEGISRPGCVATPASPSMIQLSVSHTETPEVCVPPQRRRTFTL